MKDLILVCVLTGLFGMSSMVAQQMGSQSLDQLEASPAGSKIILFVNTVNKKSTPTNENISVLFTPRLIEKLGESKLSGFLQEIQQVDGGLVLYDVKREDMFAYTGKARGQKSGEWLELTYSFENSSPYRIDGFTLEQSRNTSENPPLYPTEAVGFERPKPLGKIQLNSEKERSRFLNDKLQTLPDNIETYVKAYTDIDIFSGVVLLADRGEVIYQKAFGLADRDHKRLNSMQTTFNIGSMNKSFTSIIVAQLVHEGLLSMDSKMTDILPDFRQKDADKITIEHLLSHTSGFGDYYSMEFMKNKGLENDAAALLKHIQALPMHFGPGDDQMYSNVGYVILGAIIKEMTGMSYPECVTTRILEPLKMQETYVVDVKNAPNRSIGYMQSTTGAVIDNLAWFHEPNPSGGFWSTAQDVLTFYQSFFYDEKLLPQSKKMKLPLFKMIAPYFQDDRAAIPLAGGSNGLNTVLCEMLGERISIIVLANMDEPVAEQLGLGILDIVRGDIPQMPQLPAHMNVYAAYKEYGIAYIKEHFVELTVNFHPTDPKDFILNRAGYDLMQEKIFSEAIELLTLNADLFPEVANCYDSLGEAHYAAGNLEKAKQYYSQALEIDPNLGSALEMVKKLN